MHLAPRVRRLAIVALVATVAIAFPLAQSAEKVDYDALYKIRGEGLQRSEVMEIASYLTDIHGPRLTNSPSYKAAADYVQKAMTDWGLVNVHTEGFPFGQGWSNERMVAHAVTPSRWPILAYPKAWTPGVDGVLTAEAIVAPIETMADFEKYKGKLKGKIVFTAPAREVTALFDPLARRFSDAALAEMTLLPVAPGGGRGRGAAAGLNPEVARQRMPFYASESVALLVDPGRGDGGTVFVGGGGNRDPKAPMSLPQVVMAVEHYNRIVRTISKGVPVSLEFEIHNTFHTADLNAYNIIGEIPGSDPKVGSELVMLGGHFDGWHTGTGATDNAAGSAIMLEALRILKATGLKPRRTVRIGLWSAEEQGLIGSRTYVTEHFADRATMQLKPDHSRFSAYFNVDNGTGAIRGVYLQGNDAAAPIFAAWMEPFRSLGMTTLTLRNTGGTDHLSFDAVGLPGFQFIQDPVEYSTRTHHSNMDVYDRLQAPDLMKNAVIVASFVYHAANRDEKLPRKPLPAPQPAGGRGRGF
ncbi:MAG: M20/M25/M40 family metallo-hydrolase [Acidobacteriota bacterium]